MKPDNTHVTETQLLHYITRTEFNEFRMYLMRRVKFKELTEEEVVALEAKIKRLRER
jgi:hypothetical protein